MRMAVAGAVLRGGVWTIALSACAVACGASESLGASQVEKSSADSGADAGSDFSASPPTGPCNAVVQQHPIEGFFHVDVCSPVTYGTRPPSSGNHYPVWAAYQSYASAIPEGFWVHDLEHGAVVFSYNCPGGCPADVAAAGAYITSAPRDPLCDPSIGNPPARFVMTPDPNLDVKFGASAWGWTLRADCFDAAAFGAFVQAHYGNGPEAICAQGQDVSAGCGDL